MPAYDLSLPADRLSLALAQLNKQGRAAIRDMVRKRYGDEAARQLVEALKLKHTEKEKMNDH